MAKTRPGQQRADELEAMWAESARRHRERLRRENRALWYGYFCRLAENHARLAAGFEARAESLLEEPDRGEGRR